MDTVFHPWVVVKEVSVVAESTRRERGLARLAELGDEPGGDAFIELLRSFQKLSDSS